MKISISLDIATCFLEKGLAATCIITNIRVTKTRTGE